MVRGLLSDAAAYEGLHPRFAKAFGFLQSRGLADFAALPPGRIVVDGEDVFVNVDDAALAAWDPGAALEVHRRYIDIHVPVSGEEVFGYTCDEANVEASAGDFDVGRDCGFLRSPAMARVAVKPGEFVVFYPRVAHLPCRTDGAPRPHRKLVVKVRA